MSYLYPEIEQSLNPLSERERHVIKSGTKILGGVLLTRAGIVSDAEENLEIYQKGIDGIESRLEYCADIDEFTKIKAVQREVDEKIPYRPNVYQAILKSEAKKLGRRRIRSEDRIGMSRFVSVGGICHQHALYAATLLSLMEEQGEIEGECSLESTLLYETHPDRHTRVEFQGREGRYILDMAGGISVVSPPPV